MTGSVRGEAMQNGEEEGIKCFLSADKRGGGVLWSLFRLFSSHPDAISALTASVKISVRTNW